MNPRLLRPTAPSGFNPKRLSGLSAWYDATVASSVTLTSGFVSQWSDLSGAGHHLSQSVEADRPGTGTIGGKTAVDFDGSNDYLSNAAAPSGWESGTIFFLHERDGGGNQNGYGLTTAANNTMYASINNVANEYRTGAGSNGSLARSGGTATAGTQRILTHTTDNSTAGLRVSGAAVTGTTGGFLPNVVGTYLGVRNSSSLGLGLFWNGKVGEFIIYNRVLSASEITKVEQYLAAKWGVTLA
jgi:hypothetical protein